MSNDIDFADIQKPPTILVVEDDAPDQVLVKQKIKTLWPECNIVPVGSLKAAYDTFKARDFDMVMLDLNLPDTMGPETVEEMRKFNKSTPIIVLTGMLNSATADESLRLGANNIFPKSQIVDSEDFFNILEQNVKS